MTDQKSRDRPQRDPTTPEGARTLLDALPTHAVFELDGEGQIVTWPAAAERLYGYEPAAMLGESLTVLLDEDADLETPIDAVLRGAETGTATIDGLHQRANGEDFWATLEVARFGNGPDAGYAAISRDTTERHERERRLERQNDRLKEFTDILVHDLRTPLSVIDGKLSLYEDTGDPEYLEAVVETTERMERLVDDLLQVARQGNVVTDPEATTIAAVAETAWEGVQATADRATLQVGDVGSVSADRDRLRELFENLFRNAVEHAGPEVTVRVGSLPEGFYVEDDGPGIPENLRDEVFDHGVSTARDGSGYGLSIVRTIANAHGWDVTATESESGGARFEVTGVDTVE